MGRDVCWYTLWKQVRKCIVYLNLRTFDGGTDSEVFSLTQCPHADSPSFLTERVVTPYPRPHVPFSRWQGERAIGDALYLEHSLRITVNRFSLLPR